MKPKRYTPKNLTINPDFATDQLILIANNIEEALLLMDAEPGKDYSKKDLMEWAVQLAVSKNEDLQFQWQQQ